MYETLMRNRRKPSTITMLNLTVINPVATCIRNGNSLAVAGGFLFCAVLFSHEMSWMRSIWDRIESIPEEFSSYFCMCFELFVCVTAVLVSTH